MNPIDPSVVRAPPAKFSVFVDDNSTAMGESKRYLLGEFTSYEEAAAVCRKIVDDFLLTSCKPEITGDELFAAYKAFGEDPFILPDNGAQRFSAWGYACGRCAEMNRRRGFTLVGMMVAIDVLCALAGILL
jgi:hypothetical protein